MERTTRPIKPQALWIRVDQNRVKLAVFIGLFVLGSATLLTIAFVGVPGSLIGLAVEVGESEPAGYWEGFRTTFVMVFGGLLLVGGVAAAVQIANAEDWVTSRFRARPYMESDGGPGIERAVAGMALAAGLSGPPRILAIDSDSLNACVIGVSRTDPAIAFTTGMLSSLEESELRAVVAALLSRVASGDVFFATALAALMGPVKALRDLRGGTDKPDGAVSDFGFSVVDSCCSSGDGCIDGLGDADSADGCLTGIAFVIFAAVVLALTYAAVLTAAWIVTVWGRVLHRTSHEKSDAEGMLLLKDPMPMLSALRKSVKASNLIGDSDASYDAIFYAQTSGTPAVERVEVRRFDRLREVLGVDGAQARLEE